MNVTLVLLLIAGLLSGVIQVLNKKLAGSKHQPSTHVAFISLVNRAMVLLGIFLLH